MYVFGQLKEASLEIIDGTPAELQAGRIYYDKSTRNVKVIHKDSNGTYRINVSVPIGTILPIIVYTDVAHSYHIPIDEETFTWVDGRTINDPKSPFNGMTLPDLTGRYIMGVGNDGGGNLSDSFFDSQINTVSGNANHVINLYHNHQVNAHSHSYSHSHGAGTLLLGKPASSGSGCDTHMRILNVSNSNCIYNATSIYWNVEYFLYKAGIEYVASSGYVRLSDNTSTYSGYTGNSSPYTNYAMSSNTNIQPRTIKVRYIIRYK